MQGGRDPFSGFRDPFSRFGGFGGFGGQSLMSSFFGGRDPFDDPFFTRPFGSSFGSSFFGSTGGPFMNVSARGPFLNANASGFLEHQPSLPNTSARGPFLNANASGFLEHQPSLPNTSARGPFLNANTSGFLEHQPSLPNTSRGLVIEELNSEDETDENESRKEYKVNPRKHSRSSKEPIVEDPDDEAAEKKSKHMPCKSDLNLMHHGRPHPQTHSFTFQSSSVTYGGANGAYYTSSRTRRTGSDGLSLEECKEANSNTGQATHRISRGLHEKGHSFTRKLKSDGRVDTMQTLHNLNEDELVGFEEAWLGNARKQLPGWSEGLSSHNVMAAGGSNQLIQTRGGSAFPSTERSNGSVSLRTDSGRGAGFPSRQLGRKKTDMSDGTSSSHFRSNGTNHVKRC